MFFNFYACPFKENKKTNLYTSLIFSVDLSLLPAVYPVWLRYEFYFWNNCDSFSEIRRDLCSSYFYCTKRKEKKKHHKIIHWKNVLCKKALFFIWAWCTFQCCKVWEVWKQVLIKTSWTREKKVLCFFTSILQSVREGGGRNSSSLRLCGGVWGKRVKIGQWRAC